MSNIHNWKPAWGKLYEKYILIILDAVRLGYLKHAERMAPRARYAMQRAAGVDVGFTEFIEGELELRRTEQLEAIAAEHLGLSTLATRESDDLDFSTHAVWELRKALAAAYAAGQASRE